MCADQKEASPPTRISSRFCLPLPSADGARPAAFDSHQSQARVFAVKRAKIKIKGPERGESPICSKKGNHTLRTMRVKVIGINCVGGGRREYLGVPDVCCLTYLRYVLVEKVRCLSPSGRFHWCPNAARVAKTNSLGNHVLITQLMARAEHDSLCGSACWPSFRLFRFDPFPWLDLSQPGRLGFSKAIFARLSRPLQEDLKKRPSARTVLLSLTANGL